MKQFIQSAILFIAFISLHSCIDDKGNYTYQDEKQILPIEIEGVEKEITAQVGDILSITPKLKGMDNPDKYSYEWYVMESSVSSKRKDISSMQNLEYKVELDPGKWRLFYKVTDIKRNVYVCVETSLTVIANAIDNTGWYVLKDDNQNTDFDFINEEGTVYRDVLALKNIKVPGIGISMEYQTGYRHNIIDQNGKTVTLLNQRAFHIVTNKELYTINATTFELFKNFNDHFYTIPNKCQPEGYVKIYNANFFMQNEGKLYALKGTANNIGKFFPIPGDYKLYKQGGIPIGMNNYIVFDEIEHSFYIADVTYNYFIDMPELEQNNEIFSFKNMPYSVISVGYNLFSQGYFIMKHNEKEEGQLIRIVFSYSPSVTSVSTIPQESKMLQTDIIAPAYKSDFVYFKYGNSVYSYENSKDLALKDKEKEIITYTDDETIVSIKNIFVANKRNQLAVLTNKDKKWKLYIYNLIGESNPEINPEPVHVFEGDGYGRYLLSRF